MGDTRPSTGGDRHSLAERVRRRKREILRTWEQAVRGLPQARTVSEEALVDHLPHLLSRVADMIEDLAAGREPPPPTTLADDHAHARLEEGLEIGFLVREWALLRAAVLTHVDPGPEGIVLLDRAIDEVVATSVDRYAAARHRTLQALDRISSAALESESLEALLRRLLQVFLETTAAVDTAGILLREGDELRVRAAVGLDDEATTGFKLAIGDGFAGRVAAERRPLLLRDAARDPLVRNPALRARGVRALYGVPLVSGPELVGVAHMGSLTAFDFSEADRRLFRMATERATAGIVMHNLRDRAAAEGRARAETAARLERERRLLSTVVEQLPVGVVVAAAPSGEILLVNRACERIVHGPVGPGRTVEDLARGARGRRPDGTAYRPDDWPLVRALHGETVAEEELALERPDGDAVVVLTRAAPVRDEAGRVAAAVLTADDVTARRRAEADLARTVEFRERLVGIMGHDLRNPLASIRLSAQALLAHGEVPERYARAIARILRGSERMEALIGDMVDFARSRLGGSLPVRLEPVRLDEVARAVLDELEPAHPDRPLGLDAPGAIEGIWDRGRLAQVVSNLVANALQHGTPGTPVRVRLRRDGAEATIEVHNQGPRIPPEQVPRLFEPFRGSPGTERLGLGLYIVDQIVAAHRGTVEVVSTDAETCFRVRLPAGR